MAVPQEILDLVQFHPVEDIALAVLRQRITSVPVNSQIEYEQPMPSIVVHRGDMIGGWPGDERFLDSAWIDVFVFASGLDADADAALISDAVRVALLAGVNQVIPGLGHMTEVIVTVPPRNVADWDTAPGPVQYADLPAGVIRYLTSYQITIRKP